MSKFHHPSSRIVLRTENKIDRKYLDNNIVFELEGDKSGNHTFNLTISDDQYSLCLIPDITFNFKEEVTLKINDISTLITVLKFEICDKKAIFSKNDNSENNNLHEKGFLDFTVHVNNNPSSENIFFKLNSPQIKTVNIFSSNPTPIFSEDWGLNGFDFKVNENNLLSYYVGSSSSWMIMDSYMNLVDSISCVNGYSEDRHESLAYPNSRYFLMVMTNNLMQWIR